MTESNDISLVDDVRAAIRRIVGNRSIEDEEVVIQTIVKAVTNKYVTPELIEQAVRQTIDNYETKLRVFAIAAANRQLNRILRLINLLDDLEQEFEQPGRFMHMEDKELIKLYAIMQANLTTSLDYVKKVIDFRMELGKAQASLITTPQHDKIKGATDIPSLNASQRDRVRKLIQGLVDESLESDTIDIEGSSEAKDR